MSYLALVFSFFLSTTVWAVKEATPFNPPVCSAPKSKLFQSEEILNLEIKGDWGNLNHKNSTPGSIIVKTQTGSKQLVPVQLNSRGKSRFAYCKFKPVRMTWGKNKKQNIKGTLFEKLKGKSLKLTTHCTYIRGNIKEQKRANDFVRKEYTLYKILQKLNLNTFNVRLAKIKYLDPKGNEQVEGFGFFLEPGSSIGQRCNLKRVKETMFEPDYITHPKTLIPYLLARLAVDSRDYVPHTHHNSKAYIDKADSTKAKNKVVRAYFPYDFNDSGLVQQISYQVWEFSDTRKYLDYLKQGPFYPDDDDIYGSYMDTKHEDIDDYHAELFKQIKLILLRRPVLDSYIHSLDFDKSYIKQLKEHFEEYFGALEDFLKDNDQ